MLPAFADKVFNGGASALAVLTSAVGAGSIMTGVVLSRHSAWLNKKVVRVAVIAAGLLIVVFGASDEFWLAVPIITLLGVILSLVGVGSQILIQTHVDEEVRGRVSSLWGMIAFGGTAIGSLIVGSISAMFGLQLTVIVTGLLCAAAAWLSAD
jgi:predicted MFS family arabinose efflux permease